MLRNSFFKDMVRALILDRKNQTPASAPVKAVEQSVCNCGEVIFIKLSTTNSNKLPLTISKKSSCKQVKTISIEEITSIKTEETISTGLFIDSVQSTSSHKGTCSFRSHGVSKTDFERYVTANDAVLRNMQNQGQNLQSQMANLTDMLSKFVTANTASTSGSGTLPGNTVTNPKEDLKGITYPMGCNHRRTKQSNHETRGDKGHECLLLDKNAPKTSNLSLLFDSVSYPNPEPIVSPLMPPI
ncbi:hypothetical protein Tco_0668530 [Tanacetum coccineum]